MPGDGATRSPDTCRCVSVFCTWWWRLSHPPHGPAHPGMAIFHSAQSPLLTGLIVPHCSGGSEIHLCGGKAVLCMCHPHNIFKNLVGSLLSPGLSSPHPVSLFLPPFQQVVHALWQTSATFWRRSLDQTLLR